MAEGRVIDQPRPRGAQPVVLAMLVLIEVSSIKPILVSRLAMKGWRRVIQMCRAAATSGRFCSAAIVLEPMAHQWLTVQVVFFMRQTEVAQQPPDRAAVHRSPMRRDDLGGQFRHGQVALLADPAGDPILQP